MRKFCIVHQLSRANSWVIEPLSVFHYDTRKIIFALQLIWIQNKFLTVTAIERVLLVLIWAVSFLIGVLADDGNWTVLALWSSTGDGDEREQTCEDQLAREMDFVRETFGTLRTFGWAYWIHFFRYIFVFLSDWSLDCYALPLRTVAVFIRHRAGRIGITWLCWNIGV